MKAASLADIRKELKTLDPEAVLQACLRLGRFKKENKELLTYLLFEAGDEEGFVSSIKEEIDFMMTEVNVSHLYYAKKGLQKINRNLTKYIRYSGNKETEVEVRIHFCKAIKSSGIAVHRNTTLTNLYVRQIKNIRKAMYGLHEDLQADYQFELDEL